MSDQGVVPSVFSQVHAGRRTPWIAILFTVSIALVLLAVLGGNPDALDTLGSTTVVLLLLAFIMVNVSVMVLRSDRVDHEHFRTPTIFPILGVLVSVALLIYTAVSDISIFYLAALLLGIGLILYAVNFLVKRSVDRDTPQARE